MYIYIFIHIYIYVYIYIYIHVSERQRSMDPYVTSQHTPKRADSSYRPAFVQACLQSTISRPGMNTSVSPSWWGK